MKGSITRKLISAFAILILASVLILNFLVGLKLRDYFESSIAERLKSNAILLSSLLSLEMKANSQTLIQNRVSALSKELDTRITVLNSSGTVLAESEVTANKMDNHLSRLEVIRALKDGIGQSTRHSDTMGYNMKYVAVTMSINEGQSIKNGIVRLSLPLSVVESQINVIYRAVLFGGIVAFAFVVLIGALISRGIIISITEMEEAAMAITAGDFSKRITIKRNDELGILAESMNRMSSELELKIEHLKQADKMKSDFVANVSHEMKTPLTSIKGFIETLEDGALDDKQNARRFLAIIKKHAEGLSNIINDLLNLSELESEKPDNTWAEFDLRELVEDVASGFGHALSVRKQTLLKDYRGSNFTIVADRYKMESMLVNLIDNSLKYTNEGGKVIVGICEQEGYIVLSVEDNGSGMAQKHQDRVFERFYRVDNARSRKLGGTGLGLAIVKHTILLHGGSVQIDSTEGVGTKVSAKIPRK